MTHPLPKKPATWCVLGIIAGALTLATGCTGGQTPPTQPSSTTPRLPTSQPPVTRPLEAKKYQENPCALFTDEQAKVLGFLKPGENYITPDDSACVRQKGKDVELSDLIVTYHPTDLIGQIYRRETRRWASNWLSPITIVGQPALITTNPRPEPCRIAIGLNDNEGIEIRVEDRRIDPCAQATQVAETIIRNLEA